MTLKTTTRTVIEVDEYDLNKFISDEYGHDFECVADQEWDNDQSHLIEIEKTPLDSVAEQKVTKFRETGRYSWSLYALLQDLCNCDKLSPGSYLITVRW